MKKLKIIVVGAGAISRMYHLPTFAASEGAEVYAVCDADAARARAAAGEFGAAHWFTDYRDMVKYPEADAVDVCTMNKLHSEVSVFALRHGFHVFCEKPDAISLGEMENMKKAAEETGRLLMVMRNNRFIAQSRYLKAFIESGGMGEIYAVRCGWIRRRGIPGKGGWFTTKALSGGGPLIDLGIHITDLGMWLMGNPAPVTVSGCTFRNFAESDVSDSVHSSFGNAVKGGTFDVEDGCMGFVRFEGGACMQLEYSWASNIEHEDVFLELRGTKAGCRWSQDESCPLKIFTEENGCTVDIVPNLPKEAKTGHVLNLEHFISVLRGGEEPCYKPEQGLNMLKIIDAMYRSAETGGEVRV